MAWLTNYGDAPTIVIEKTQVTNYLVMPGWNITFKWKHVLTTLKFQRTCLTQTAAESALAYYNAQTGTSAIMRRVDASAQYVVEVNQETYTFTEEGAA